MVGGVGSVGACSGSGSGVPDAAADVDAPLASIDSCATHAPLYAFDPDRTRMSLFDLTGDAQPDIVTMVEAAPMSYRLDIGDPATARVTLPGQSAYLASVGAVDINLDGQRDLVIGLLWERRAFVILGPLGGDLDETDAFVTIAGPPEDGGLSPMFGAAVLVDDVNLDGASDIVVTAPAEREENCAGQLAPRVHLGPFTAGAQLDESDADMLLAGPMACLGEGLACTDTGFRASTRSDAVCFTYPLTTAEPASCP